MQLKAQQAKKRMGMKGIGCNQKTTVGYCITPCCTQVLVLCGPLCSLSLLGRKTARLEEKHGGGEKNDQNCQDMV